MIKICFFYPSMSIGGAQLLFCRTGYELAKQNKLYKVSFIDFKQGFYESFFLDKKDVNINFIEYKSDEKVALDKLEIDHLVSPLSFVYKIKKEISFIDKNTKLFFWDLHHFNLIATSELFSLLYNKLPLNVIPKIYNLIEPFRTNKNSFFLRKLINKGGMRFMSQSNLAFNEKVFNFNYLNDFLPILISTDNINVNKKEFNISEINFCWLGRIDNDKYQLLIKFIDDLSKVSNGDRIKLHIIGSGTKLEFVKEYCKKKYSLEIIFLGVLRGSNLLNYMIENVDLLFGVGTSVLEGCIIGIPSFFGISPEYKGKKSSYSWVYSAKGNNVTAEFISNEKYSLKSIIHDYKINPKKQGRECEKYFLDNHSSEKVVTQFIEVINTNEFTVSDLDKFLDMNKSLFEGLISFFKKNLKKII